MCYVRLCVCTNAGYRSRQLALDTLLLDTERLSACLPYHLAIAILRHPHTYSRSIAAFLLARQGYRAGLINIPGPNLQQLLRS